MGSRYIRLVSIVLMSVVVVTVSNIHFGALLPVCNCEMLNAAELSFVLMFVDQQPQVSVIVRSVIRFCVVSVV